MSKQLVLCASPEDQKYYFEEAFFDIPREIKEELKVCIIEIAEKIQGIISLGFYEDGNIYIEQTDLDNVFSDDIGAALEIKKFQQEKQELLKSLRMWYMMYRTDEGKIVKDIVLLQSKKMSNKAIVDEIVKKYGQEYEAFANQLLRNE
jgi:hypothetical protein